MNRAAETWRRSTEAPLTIAALLFLAAYAWRVLDPNLSTGWRQLCDLVLWVTWALFAIDYLARFVLAGDRSRFFVRHLHDLAVVALPLLRPLRLLRLVALLGVLNQLAGRSLRGRVATYVIGGTTMILFVAALAILDAERNAPEAQITTFSDALWWAIVTTTTVGYGDLAPVTTPGKLVAVGLMLTGIALLGTVTATLASWFVERISEERRHAQADFARLADEVRQLREHIESTGRHSRASDTATDQMG
jgi:voltage-gated potassium channel